MLLDISLFRIHINNIHSQSGKKVIAKIRRKNAKKKTKKDDIEKVCVANFHLCIIQGNIGTEERCKKKIIRGRREIES